MGAAIACARHRAELGERVATFSGRPTGGTIAAFVVVWLIASGLTFINPDPNPVIAIAPAAIIGIFIATALVMLSGERLIVCQRGLIVGSVAPFLRPYVIRYDQIVPGSVAPVTGARRYGKETGTESVPQSTIRRYFWTRHGVHLVGPSAAEARRSSVVLAPLLDPGPRSVDGRWIWFVGTIQDPARATRAIAEAAGRAGLTELAQRTAAAPKRELTGVPSDAARQLPGHRG